MGEAPALLAPLSGTRSFVEVTELVSDRPVHELPASAVRRRERDGDRLVEIVGVEASTRRAAEEGLLYRETGATWAGEPVGP